MKIAYCGYDFFSAGLQVLLNNNKNVYQVFTVPGRGASNANQYIYEISKKYKIPVSEKRVTEKTISQLQQEGCDVLITAAYNYKIPPLDSTNIKGINVHPSLLPKGRGEWPLPWAILTEQKITGISIHKLTEEYDAGDILLQRSFPLDKDECLETLSAKVQMHAKDCLIEVVDDFDNLWNGARAQEGESCQWGMPSQQQRTLDWQLGVEELDRVCRAFGKFGCSASFDGQQWIVYHLRAWQQAHQFTVGDVVHKTSTEMIVAASDGLVSILYFEKAR